MNDIRPSVFFSSPQDPGRRTGHLGWHVLGFAPIAALLLVLGGCVAVPPQETAPPAPEPPPLAVSPANWYQIDHAIWTASLASEALADAFAVSAVEEWLTKVRQRTEEAFIPWYSNYWTQKWLGLKVAWYQLSQSEGDPAAAKRLATYLQEQYKARVLEPIGREINPVQITDRATSIYLDGIRETLGEIPLRYPVTPAALEVRLAAIPAIALPPPSSGSVSLHQVLHTGEISGLPAYRALTGRDGPNNSSVGSPASRTNMQTAANRVVAKLPLQLALQGGGTVAALLGGVPGILISAGISGWDAAQHALDQPEMESQLTKALAPALEDVRRDLLAGFPGGVLAPVRHLSARIESSLSVPYRQ